MRSTQMSVWSFRTAIRLTLALAGWTLIAYGQDRTPTGFYYPRSSNLGPYAGFLASGCNGARDYFAGQFHIGKDSWAWQWEPVYAIADGEVLARSLHGWSLDGHAADATLNSNVGILVLHHTSSNVAFQALYGHIRSWLRPGDRVFAGQVMGYVGDWGNQPHVHFGVRIPPNGNPQSLPSGSWGRPSCSEWPSAIDGFLDPIAFINTHYPLGAPPMPPAYWYPL